MTIKVKFYSLFKINLKSSGEVYEIKNPITISELINKLDNDYDDYFTNKLLNDKGKISPGAIILVNGKNILHLNNLKTELKDGDTITLFPPSAGG